MGNLYCENIYIRFTFLWAQIRLSAEVPVRSFLRLAVWCEDSLGAGFFPLDDLGRAGEHAAR